MHLGYKLQTGWVHRWRPVIHGRHTVTNAVFLARLSRTMVYHNLKGQSNLCRIHLAADSEFSPYKGYSRMQGQIAKLQKSCSENLIYRRLLQMNVLSSNKNRPRLERPFGRRTRISDITTLPNCFTSIC
jgi:hypothetical protein